MANYVHIYIKNEKHLREGVELVYMRIFLRYYKTQECSDTITVPSSPDDSDAIGLLNQRYKFIAGTVICLVLLSIGMMIVFPTLVNGSLHSRNSKEVLVLNDNEASWFGSLMYLVQPLCCIFGALLQPYIGRKYGLMLTLAVQIISWICLSVAESIEHLYLSVIMFGISAGSMEAPAYSYLGEISESRLRSLLTCMTNISVFAGILFEYSLGSFFYWRQIAAMSTALPVIGILLLFLIPDSPIWLLKRDREEAAIRSLCWLRGWVKEDSVKTEFEDMRSYIKNSRIRISDKSNNEESIKTNFFERGWKKVTRSKLWQPLLLVAVCHFCFHCTNLTGMKSYFIEILDALPVTLEPTRFLFINSLLTICGGIICFLTVKSLGKRKLILFSSSMTSLICMLLGAYIFWNGRINIPWIPSILIWALHLFLSAGVGPIPWMLTSEIFSAKFVPKHDRSVGAGLAAASYYVIAFPFSKTFYNIKEIIQLSGCFILYGVLGFIGSLYLYLYLPETEGKSLAEVEEYFSKESKKPSILVVT